MLELQAGSQDRMLAAILLAPAKKRAREPEADIDDSPKVAESRGSTLMLPLVGDLRAVVPPRVQATLL